jgi:predicted DNA-binding protein (MmcQ/YjbR family)
MANKKAFAKDQRLERVTKICKALPEAFFELAGQHASYQVRQKTFAYYLNNHHGDGIISVCCKVLPGENTALIAAHPKKFYSPAYIGPRGWVGLRLDIPGVDWGEVTEMIRGSYRLVAPQKLAYLVRV